MYIGGVLQYGCMAHQQPVEHHCTANTGDRICRVYISSVSGTQMQKDKTQYTQTSKRAEIDIIKLPEMIHTDRVPFPGVFHT